MTPRAHMIQHGGDQDSIPKGQFVASLQTPLTMLVFQNCVIKLSVPIWRSFDVHSFFMWLIVYEVFRWVFYALIMFLASHGSP